MFRSLLLVTTLALILLSSVGCRGNRFFTPRGTMNRQQANAVVHDPFPQADLGPSDLGARPPSYQQPLAEPVRNRLVPDAMPWLGR
ncbi:MAG: membrane or secreted protein [Planctomycetota bacterium]